MKKYLVIAAAAVAALSACTKTTVDSTPDEAITFQVANYQASTKADNYDNFKDAGGKFISFGTYAWFYQDGLSYSATDDKGQVFMNDEEISHSESGELWKPSTTYYWPKTGTIDFISYSPKSASDYVTVTRDGITVKQTYTVIDKTTEDLMYADKAVGCTGAANADKDNYKYGHVGVPTLFRHALAKINISIMQSKLDDGKNTSWKVTVKNVTLSNILNEGGVVLSLKADKTTWALPGEASTPATYNTFNTTGGKIASTVLYPMKSADSGIVLKTDAQPFATDYIVMPQVLVATDASASPAIAGQQLTITYDIETTLSNGQKITETGATATIDLVSGSLKAWEMNKNITYTITITPNAEKPIYFDPAVVAWENDSANFETQF